MDRETGKGERKRNKKKMKEDRYRSPSFVKSQTKDAEMRVSFNEDLTHTSCSCVFMVHLLFSVCLLHQ